MRTFLYLLAQLVSADAPDVWNFVDAANHRERSVLTFRTVDLVSQPRKLLSPNEQPPAGARFSELPVGPGGQHRVAVVWHSPSGALWIDGNADGRFGPSERHTLTGESIDTKITIPFGATEKHERTLVVRKRGDGLAYALRGYLTGSLTIGKASYRALLTDGDADGCFDNPAADRIWIDKNDDGQFDPLTEHFTLGHPVTIGNVAYLIRPDPLARSVAVAERPSDTGKLLLNVARLPSAKVVDFHAPHQRMG